MFRNRKKDDELENNIGQLVKEARKKKGISARKLADLCDISHTEINNIEQGIRMKPALLTLKGLEKYLGLPFEQTAKMVGYSDDTIKYGEDNIIVSYEKYDKMIEQYKIEYDHMLYIIQQKIHLGKDMEEYFKSIHDYLKQQDNVSKKILNDAIAMENMIQYVQRKYVYITKEK